MAKEEFIKEAKYGRAAWYSFGRALLIRFIRYLVVKYELDYVGLKEEWDCPRYTLIMCSDDDNCDIEKLFQEFSAYQNLIHSYDVYNHSWALRDLDIFPIIDVYFTEDKKDKECSILVYKENPNEVVFKKNGRRIVDGIPRKNKIKKLEERAMSFGKQVEY